MKILKKTLKLFSGLFVALLLLIMYAPFMGITPVNKNDYSGVIRDAVLSETTLVTNVAMLGAHDAFSHKIGLFSKTDPGDDGIVSNGAVKAFFKGGVLRVSRAQKSSAAQLLRSGVRYFDVRVSYVDGEWMTKHGLISTTLSSYLKDIYAFLNENPKEFIIFDLQHIYLADQSLDNFIDYLTTNAIGGNVFTEYIHYSSEITLLSELNYANVHSSDQGGIIFVAEESGEESVDNRKLFYARSNTTEEGAIRSTWHNKQTVKEIIPAINEEYEYLSALDNLYFFRVNQAQLTPDYLKNPLLTLKDWSLLNLAKQSNVKLLEHENFDEWLEMMPIFMVDFADSKTKSFNERVNSTILEYNKNI